MRLFIILALLFLQINLYSKQTNIVLQLNWLHQFQFAGFYIAKEKGFYKKEDLHVDILEYDKSDLVEKISNEKIDFAMGNSSLIVNKNKNIAMIMPVFQSSPMVLITTNPKIKNIKDLRNKNIMIKSSSINSISIMAMLQTSGLTINNFNIVPHSLKLQDLIDKKTDVMASYISNEPYILRKQNLYFKVFNPKDFRFDFYGDILFTSQTFIKKNPLLVQKFYEASKKGWLYAFSHIEETAKIIFENYNTQNKSLEHLIFEGRQLEKLAFDHNDEFGKFDLRKTNKIVDIYKLFNFLPKKFELEELVNPTGLGKKQIRIGVLAKRGKNIENSKWAKIIKHLNSTIPNYCFNFIPYTFDEIDKAIANKKIDFIFTNTMQYIQMKHKYKISSIATMLNLDLYHNKPLDRFGAIIFTIKNRNDINTLQDIKNKKFAAVNKHSFGGWLMAKKTLLDNDIVINDKDLIFEHIQDNVVYSVLHKEADVGTVRTNILEAMQKNGKISINDFKIINKKSIDQFPFLLSTELYPEWPFAKLEHTSQKLALELVQALISSNANPEIVKESHIYGWTIPINDTKVEELIKELELYPYEKTEITLQVIYERHKFKILTTFFIFIIILVILYYTYKTNIHLKEFTKELEEKVRERTDELMNINKKLKFLANTDELTSIDNRRSFFKKISQYITIAKRNKTPLFYISLDLDFFKKINDTYGHDVGDKMLKHFTHIVSQHLRESDIFGRVGGEEFSICTQNTSRNGTMVLAEKIKFAIENTPLLCKNNQKIYITVSMGIAEYKDTLINLIKNADDALYQAKNTGRNKIILAT